MGRGFRVALFALLVVCASCGRIGFETGDGIAVDDMGTRVDLETRDADVDADPEDLSVDATLDASDLGAGSAGIIVAPSSGLITTEAGGTDTFTVVLASAPSADVVLAVSSSDTDEGTVSPASVTFTTANWNAPQTVTVAGVDDGERDGNIAYTVVTSAAASSDVRYAGLAADDVSVINIDNESPGVMLSRISGLATTEAGGTDTFNIALIVAPMADVTILLESDTETEATVSPSSVTFTTLNWSSPQTVTVTGVDDAIVDGDAAFTIVTSTTASTDADYNGIDVSDVIGINACEPLCLGPMVSAEASPFPLTETQSPWVQAKKTASRPDSVETLPTTRRVPQGQHTSSSELEARGRKARISRHRTQTPAISSAIRWRCPATVERWPWVRIEKEATRLASAGTRRTIPC